MKARIAAAAFVLAALRPPPASAQPLTPRIPVTDT
jgi:hypothetical protein